MGVLQTYSKNSPNLAQLKRLVGLYQTANVVVKSGSPMPAKTARRRAPEEVQSIVDLYESGMTVYEVSSELNVPRTMVSKYLARAGVLTRRRPLSENQVDEAVRLYESGSSLARVGQQIGVAPTTIRVRLVARGIPMRDTTGCPRSSPRSS